MSASYIELQSRTPERTDRDSLFLLYRPLCGQDAVILYETLMSLSCRLDRIEPEQLLRLSGIGSGRMEKARKNLEMFGLLDVYTEPVSGRLLYAVNPPLDVSRFLRHQVFSRLLLNTVGSEQFDRLMQFFAVGASVPEGWMRQTADIDPEPLEREWSEEKEQSLQKLLPARDTAGFDWEKFYRNREYLFPVRMRTRANEELIANLARLYGLSEEQMVKYVSRACPPPMKILDQEALKNIIRSERRREFLDRQDPFENAPVLFLQERQKGAPVSDADRRMLGKLSQEYRFTGPVINELLDYTMEQTNGALPGKYVEKVAGTWARLGLDTREKVRDWRKKQTAQALQGVRKRKGLQVQPDSVFSGRLPDWYNDRGRQFASEEERQQMLKQIEDIKKNWKV